MSTFNRWLVLAVAVLLIAVPMFGASQNAVIYGTVYDASANPMPGVTVTLENSALGFSRTTVTGSDGSYNFAEVPPADGYKLVASKAGKVIDTRTGITVNVGEESVLAPPLKEQAPVVATTTTKNEPVAQVERKSVRTETVSTSQSGVITGEQLRQLPLYNRNFLALGGITPNVHDLAGGDPLLGASFSVGGQRGTQNNFLLDGADNVASSSNQAVPFQVNDAVQEFRLISNNAPAEYGRSAGGMVNVVTRRGGNKWHGSGFGYFGSDVLNSDGPISVFRNGGFFKAARYAGPLNAAPLVPSGPGGSPSPINYNEYVATAAANGYCTNSISGTLFAGSVACASTGGFGLNTLFDPSKILSTRNSFKPPFSSQQAGFNMGGPVVKDKVFMFASYEGTRIDNPNPIFERVPSTFDRTFNPLLAAGDPNAAAYTFTSDSPDYLIAAKIMSLYPQPNVIGVPNALEFFQGEAPNYTHVHNALGRVDWVQNADNNWSFRYVAQLLHQLHDDSLPKQNSYPGNGALRDVLNQNLNIGQSHTFSASLINEAHVGFNRFNVEDDPQDAGFDPHSLGINMRSMPTFLLSGIDPQYSGGTPSVLGASQNWLLGIIGVTAMEPSLDGLFPMARLGAPLNAPARRTDMTWFISDGVSWTTGKHSFKFGAEFRRLINEFQDASYQRGFVSSENIGAFTSDSPSFNYAAPSFDYAVQQPRPYGTSFHSYAFGAYVQDTVRLDPKLTLTLGLRYDLYSQPNEDHNQIWNYDPKSNGLVQQGGNAVQDPFGHNCNGFGVSDLSSITDLSGFFGSWNCSPSPQDYRITTRYTDFSPRVGVVWDPLGNGRTILRGGAGMFYDQLPASFTSQMMYNRPVDVTTTPTPTFNLLYGQQVGVLGYGNNSLNTPVDPVVQLATSPFPVYARDPNNANTPYTWQFNLTWQQQISNKVVSEIGYVGSMSNKLPLIYNQNFNNEYTPSGFTDGEMGLFPIFTMTNQGESNYNSLMARIRVADFHGVRFNGTYTWSHSLDNASNAVWANLPVPLNDLAIMDVVANFNLGAFCLINGSGSGFACPARIPPLTGVSESSASVTTTGANGVVTTPYYLPQDPAHFLRDDYGQSDFDSRHRFVADFTWDVPSLQKRWGWSKWLDYWSFSGIYQVQSGLPYTIFAGPIGGEINQRINTVGTITTSDNPNAAITLSNPIRSLPGNGIDGCSALGGSPLWNNNLSKPGACVGNTGRNAFVGPYYNNFDFSVQKGFPIFGEGKMLSVRSEFFNLFNSSNFYNPNSVLSLDGRSFNPEFGKIQSAHDPRRIQLAVRFNF